MGTKYFSTNLYGYEIFSKVFVWVRNNFYKLVKDCWITLNFCNLLILEKSPSQSHFLIHFYIYVLKSIFGIPNYLIICECVGPVPFPTSRDQKCTYLCHTFYSDDIAPKNADQTKSDKKSIIQTYHRIQIKD